MGFTLVEVIVVLGLLGILGALAYPQYRSWAQNTQYREVAREVASTLREARSLAISSSLAHQVSFSGGVYELERFVPASASWQSIKSFKPPGHVSLFNYPIDGKTPPDSVAFFPNGSASDVITILIRDSGQNTRFTVRVSSEATGRIVIE